MPSFAENCPVSMMKQYCSLDAVLYSYLATSRRQASDSWAKQDPLVGCETEARAAQQGVGG